MPCGAAPPHGDLCRRCRWLSSRHRKSLEICRWTQLHVWRSGSVGRLKPPRRNRPFTNSVLRIASPKAGLLFAVTRSRTWASTTNRFNTTMAPVSQPPTWMVTDCLISILSARSGEMNCGETLATGNLKTSPLQPESDSVRKSVLPLRSPTLTTMAIPIFSSRPSAVATRSLRI